MDIKKLMQDMHNTSSVEEKKEIERKIQQQYSTLNESEKKVDIAIELCVSGRQRN